MVVHSTGAWGFSFNIILILFGRLELRSCLPYVFSSSSFCQVCRRILLWKFENCSCVEEECWIAFLNCSLVLSEAKSYLIQNERCMEVMSSVVEV